MWSKIKLIWLFCLLAFVLSSCKGKFVEGGQITIRNDIMDKEFNSFQVDRIVSNNGLVPYKKELKPGDEVVLPIQGIRELRFKRRYADHFKVYEVSCPSDFNEVVQMKLIDVHTNKLQGGCNLRRRGRMTLGGLVKWE